MGILFIDLNDVYLTKIQAQLKHH